MKINAFDGTATPFMNPNLRITGGTGYYDAASGKWLTLWVEHDSDYLLTVDPETGTVATIVPSVANFEGLALGYDGRTLYGVTTTKLYKVDLVTRVQTLIGTMPGADKCESLGFAFGDFGPAVTVPGVPAAWTGAPIYLAPATDWRIAPSRPPLRRAMRAIAHFRQKLRRRRCSETIRAGRRSTFSRSPR